MFLQHVGGTIAALEPHENGLASYCRDRTLRAFEFNQSSVWYSHFTRGIGESRTAVQTHQTGHDQSDAPEFEFPRTRKRPAQLMLGGPRIAIVFSHGWFVHTSLLRRARFESNRRAAS